MRTHYVKQNKPDSKREIPQVFSPHIQNLNLKLYMCVFVVKKSKVERIMGGKEISREVENRVMGCMQ